MAYKLRSYREKMRISSAWLMSVMVFGLFGCSSPEEFETGDVSFFEDINEHLAPGKSDLSRHPDFSKEATEKESEDIRKTISELDSQMLPRDIYVFRQGSFLFAVVIFEQEDNHSVVYWDLQRKSPREKWEIVLLGSITEDQWHSVH